MTKVDNVIAQASAELGRPYVYGAEGPNTFDCSGLMQYIYAKIGISLPRTAAQQQQATQAVTKPQPGDLVFWGQPAYHVALYIGGGKIIAAPHTGATVQVENLWGSPSKYGRVPGLGAGVAPIMGALTAATSAAGDVAGSLTSTLLGDARPLILQILGVGLGIGLLAAGAVIAVPPAKGAPG